MTTALDVKNIEAINARSEDYAHTKREFSDIATARAVADARILAEYLSPFVKPGGNIIAFKGRNVEEELEIPVEKWKILGLGKPYVMPYNISDKELNLVIWEKIFPCSVRYPRKPGEAKKNPWYVKPPVKKVHV
jgi:16S rRNA (guanine527-N7)-methyltransferase